MELTLATLFGISAILLIVSMVKNKQSSKKEQQEIDSVYVSLIDEINKLEEQIRKLELDAEITANEANIIGSHSKERALLRELLDLYRRGYTIEGIAEKTHLNEKEVEYLLAPYMSLKNERRKVANEG